MCWNSEQGMRINFPYPVIIALGSLAEDLQIVLISEDAVTGGVGGFLQDAQLLQFFDSGSGGVVADAQRGGGALDVYDGVLLQVVKRCPDVVLAP